MIYVKKNADASELGARRLLSL